MVSKKRKCRVCGKEYAACLSVVNSHDKFAWQKIACSPECGQEYFRQIALSRGEVYEIPGAEQPETAAAEEAVILPPAEVEEEPTVLDDEEEDGEDE